MMAFKISAPFPLEFAVAGVVLGAGFLLSPPAARAGACMFDPLNQSYTFQRSDIMSGFSCQAGDKVYENFSFADASLDAATFAIKLTPLPVGVRHTLSVSQGSGFTQANSYAFNYDVTANQPTIQFLSTTATPSSVATGDVEASLTYGDPTFCEFVTYTLPARPDCLFGIPVTRTDAFFLPPIQALSLRALLKVNAGSSPVAVWEHTIEQVPGPLPLLGAGAAWGASRRLRRRLRSIPGQGAQHKV